MNFNEVFRKNVTYGNIKCQKITGLSPFSGKYTFGKTLVGGEVGGKLTAPQSFWV